MTKPDAGAIYLCMLALGLNRKDLDAVKSEIVLKNRQSLIQNAEFARGFEDKAKNRLLNPEEVTRGRACLRLMQTLAHDKKKDSADLWSQVRDLFRERRAVQSGEARREERGNINPDAALQRLQDRKEELATLLRRTLNKKPAAVSSKPSEKNTLSSLRLSILKLKWSLQIGRIYTRRCVWTPPARCTSHRSPTLGAQVLDCKTGQVRLCTSPPLRNVAVPAL